MIRAGTDIGGTFTDVIVFDADSREIRIRKVLTTKELHTGVLVGLEEVGTSLESLIKASVTDYGSEGEKP